MKTKFKKGLSLLLSASIVAGSFAWHGAQANAAAEVIPGTPYQEDGTYDVTVPHVVINQVWGGGAPASSLLVSHGFIELYNPTDTNISLNEWTLYYADIANTSWDPIDLSGTIKAHSSYLIKANATNSSSPKLNLTNKIEDLSLTKSLSNQGMIVVLMSNTDTVPGATPFETKPSGYVDMLGVADKDGDYEIDAYETAYDGEAQGISKKIAVRRTNFVDTDNNQADFSQVKYGDDPVQATVPKAPRSGADGAWAESFGVRPFELPGATVGVPYNYSVADSVYGGIAPIQISVTGLTYGLSAENGVISGTPTSVGSVTVSVYASDNQTPPLSATYNTTLTIGAQAYPDAFKINKLAEYSVGESDPEGGVAEIVKYNKDNNKFYLVNGSSEPPSLDIVTLGTSGSLTRDSRMNVKTMSETNGFKFGDLTSVDINTVNDRIALAVQEEDYMKPGKILVLDYNGNLVQTYGAGVQPDMIKWSADGKYIFTADEGEPRGGQDPEGSVTIVDTLAGTSTQIKFTDTGVIGEGVHIRGASDSHGQVTGEGAKEDAVRDFEPEYIALSEDGSKAYVSLQENNAIATINIAAESVSSVKWLGLKDYNLPENALDLVKDEEIKFENVPFKGMFMPDGIATVTIDGVSYVLSANEGDVTEWEGDDEKFRVNAKDLEDVKEDLDEDSEAALFLDGKDDYDGIEVATDMGNDTIYMYGGRSFSVWNAADMSQVYDSGSDFERITAERFPANFNTGNDETGIDERSEKKGPEPEDVKSGKVGNKTFAFVGLERIGGIMTYDLTNPAHPLFSNYTNTRAFTPANNVETETGPEGIEFIPATSSPTGRPLLLVAYEVGGRVGVYELEVTKVALDQKTLGLTVGGSAAKLTATVTPVSGGAQTVAWTSSNASVATVDANGNVTPVGTGTAVITALSADGYGEAQATVTVTAPTNNNGNNNGGNNGTVTPGNNGEKPPVTGEENGKPTVTTEVKTTTSGGVSQAAVSAQQVKDAIAAIGQKAADLLIKATAGEGATQANVSIPADSFKQIAGSQATGVTVDAGIGQVSLDKSALTAVSNAATGGDVTVSIKKLSVADIAASLPQASQSDLATAIGSRPVFDFTITAGNGKVNEFNGGNADVTVPYVPAAGEDLSAIVVYYVSDAGELIAVPNGRYDAKTGKLTFSVKHFSHYAIGYNKISFTDTASQGARDDITFLAARGIVNGTGGGKFSPASRITRADFAVMLARAAGADLTAYEGTGFTDVNTSAYYAKSVRWASENGIVNGIGQGKFDPKAYVTKGQIETMIARYSAYEKLGSSPLEASGAPKDFATRAETAKMLAILLQAMV